MPKEKGSFDLLDFISAIKYWFNYLLKYWVIIVTISFVGACIGFFYAKFQKPVYTAEIVFASEAEGSSDLGGYASIAAQFGLSLGAGGNAFEGDNLIELFRSKYLIEKTLLTPVAIEGKNTFLIKHYIDNHDMLSKLNDDTILSKISFEKNWEQPNRDRDSILKSISKSIITTDLKIDRIDKKLTIISAQFSDINEQFARYFIEQLTQNAVDYFIDYKIKKAKQNVYILQKQTDSVKAILSGNISNVAESNDFNINPVKQRARIGTQKNQIDLQVSSSMYVELVKNLELSKINLRKETPFIQIIDRPKLPLDKKKKGKLKTGLLFGFFFGFFMVGYFVIKHILRSLGVK